MIKSKFAIGQVYVLTLLLLGMSGLGVFFLTHPSMLMRGRGDLLQEA